MTFALGVLGVLGLLVLVTEVVLIAVLIAVSPLLLLALYLESRHRKDRQ